MSRRHLSDDQLIDRLYGTDHEEHLEECPDCAGRWAMLQQQRRSVVEDVPEGAVGWAEQRRQILERMDGGLQASWSWQRVWAPALLTAAVLAAGLWFYRPVDLPPLLPAPVAVDTTVPGWFEETYSVMQPDEPRAASPIRVLFEQKEEKATE